MLAQGFIDLGLCQGTLDEVLETGSYKQFYMHRAGHWLGMDVHDAGLYQVQGRVAAARAGHGAHRRAGRLHPAAPTTCPRHFWDIGVRIEDDVLVTAAGQREPDRRDAEAWRRRGACRRD